MKAITSLLILIISVTQLSAQRPYRCEIPMPEPVFRQKQRSVAMQPTEELKLKAALTVAGNNCFSAQQVKAIASQFIDDYSRLRFAQAAWPNTVDKENFYFVYDEFAYFSTVFMLHDYIVSQESRPVDYIPPYEPPLSLNWPAFQYPDWNQYRGVSNCRFPMNSDEFVRLAVQVRDNPAEAHRVILLRQIVENNCIAVEQAMKLASLLQSENNRLNFFRQAIPSIYDVDNLPLGAQLFSHVPNRNAYNELIRQPVPVPQPLGPPCYVSPEEFTQILTSIKKESFNNTRVTLTRQILRSKQCFTTMQIKEIVKLFSFDDARLDIAMFAWEFTTDKDNYYLVAEEFSFSSTKEKLMKFLETK